MSAVIVLVALRHTQPMDVLKRHAEQRLHGDQQRGDLYAAVDLAVA